MKYFVFGILFFLILTTIICNVTNIILNMRLLQEGQNVITFENKSDFKP